MARLTEFERLACSLRHLTELQKNAVEGLGFVGPRLLAALTMDKSLRQVARLSQLSPTYLSQVASGKIVISAGAYLLLMETFEKVKK